MDKMEKVLWDVNWGWGCYGVGWGVRGTKKGDAKA